LTPFVSNRSLESMILLSPIIVPVV
jgi:hypothetical protein